MGIKNNVAQYINKAFKAIAIIIMSTILLTMNIMRIWTIKEVPLNLSLADLILPLALLVFIIEIIRTKSLSTINYSGFFMALMLWLIATNLQAYNNHALITNTWSASIGEWVKTATCIVYFYIGYNILKYISKITALRLMVISYGLFLFYGYLVIINLKLGLEIPILNQGIQNFFLGTYTDPNHAATYMIMGFILLHFTFHLDNNKFFKGLYLLLLLLTPIAILWTDSRGGLMAFVLAIFVYVIVRYHNNIRSMVTFTYGIIISTCLALILDSFLNQGRYIGKLYNSFVNISGGFEIRENLAKTALAMGRDHWVFGVGRGNYVINSLSYFEEMNYEFIQNIPHNTFVGLFAETGIIGVLLYAIPIWLLLFWLIRDFRKNEINLKTTKVHLAMVAGIFTGLFIQALNLNIENRRMVWFLMGLIVYMIESKNIAEPVPSVVKNEVKYNRHFFVNMIMAVVTILMLAMTVKSAYHVPPINTYYNNVVEELPVSEDFVNINMTLELYLYANQKDIEAEEMIRINIIEVEGERREVINTVSLPKVNGNLLIDFIKTSIDSKIYVEVQKEETLANYRLSLKRIFTDHKMVMLNRDYYFLDKEEETKMLYTNYQKYDTTKYIAETYKPFLADFQSTQYDQFLEIKDINVSKGIDETYVAITYKCYETVNQPLVLWVYGQGMYLNNIDRSRYASNVTYYSTEKPYDTSEWKRGQEYTIRYIIPSISGWYYLVTGGYYTVADVRTNLKNIETESTATVIGWFSTD